MNFKAMTLGVTVLGATVAGVATACGAKNKDRGTMAVADELVGKYDANRDGAIDLKTEIEKAGRLQEECLLYDRNDDGTTDWSRCLIKQGYQNLTTMGPLARRADEMSAAPDGKASASEIAHVLDSVYDDGRGKNSVSGDNVLQNDEAKGYEKDYPESSRRENVGEPRPDWIGVGGKAGELIEEWLSNR